KLAEEVEILQNTKEGVAYLGSDSPTDANIVQSMKKAIEKELKIESMVPLIGMGATDGRFTRTYGIDTYGFALFDPELPMNHYIDLTHGVNERINKKTVDLSLKVYYHLAKDYLSDKS
ncbi:M20/M25/M40 family metallo-hydrolase, partial [Candidatus Heimdallarchaeota archaeon]